MVTDYLSLEGTPEVMGLAHGEHFKEKILHLLDERNYILFNIVPKLTIEKLNQVCINCYNYFKKYCPILDREISSIAKAAGLNPYQLILVGGYTDLLDALCSKKSVNLSECSIAINPTDGYIAGTWDSHPSAIEGLILLKRKFNDTDLKTLSLTTAGWPSQQGINSSGIAFAITNLIPKSARPTGMNYIAANAVMGMSTNIESFLSFVSEVEFCSGHSYIMLDAEGKGCVVETNSETTISTKFSEKYTMTNHYCINPLIDDNSNYPFLSESIKRHLEIEKINEVINSPESFTTEMSKSEFVNKKNPHDISMTCAHFFLMPGKRELYFSKGPAIGNFMDKVLLD